ncbi:MAG TPA: hypothetical protein VEQ63_01990, partial [Bryobacteraceae bacterium]|nr:hypothetical protein [Bryobacteraceae bacterium]
GLGGQYDPTGRLGEVVMAHENDLEGALIVAEKKGSDYKSARLFLVETLAHNNYRKYAPEGGALSAETLLTDGVRPRLFIESRGHGIEAWRDDGHQHKQAPNGFLIYSFSGTSDQPGSANRRSVGYDLLPTLTMWRRASSGKNETFGEEHDFGIVTLRVATGSDELDRHIKLGVRGSALNGAVGAVNMSRPPWGWFDGLDRARAPGEWFLSPAETIRRRWDLPESFSTTYLHHPFLGVFR